VQALYDVDVIALNVVRDMPGTWTEADYLALLEALEVTGIDGLSEADLRDMALMALQDLDPEEAADAVLALKLKDAVSRGARQNILQDLVDDQRPWEEAADISLHSRIFAAAVLIQAAYPARFPRPDMLRLTLRMTAKTPHAADAFEAPPAPAFVARVLSDGMSETSVLERLFEDRIESNSFADAAGIIWQAEFSDIATDPPAATLTVYSATLWLKAMEEVESFPSDAHPDT
jgi:hypothetical protein